MLVTRPVHQAAALSALVRASGCNVYEFPGIEIRPAQNHASLQAKLKTISHCNIAIFISPNAVTYGIRAIIESVGSVPPTLRLACVGAGTITALQAAGYQCHIHPEDNFNSESLLEIPDLGNVKEKKITIFRGNGGRDKLYTVLTGRGAHVEYIECYERVEPATNIEPIILQLENNNIDIISFTSADAARNIAHMLRDRAVTLLFKLPVIAISQRVADICRELGYTSDILVAEKATNEAIVECLTNWKHNKSG